MACLWKMLMSENDVLLGKHIVPCTFKGISAEIDPWLACVKAETFALFVQFDLE